MRVRVSSGARYLIALGVATAVSVGLLLAAGIANNGFTGQYLYLAWNLFLAWIPFALSLWLVRLLRTSEWSSWGGLALTAGWLAFLPNTFYMISDFIHLPEIGASQLLLGVVVFTAFIYTGVMLGVGSLYMVHVELNKRLRARASTVVLGMILFACSVAIYIGRDLRWNSWDVLTNPAGMLFDLSSRLLHPAGYPQVLGVVVPFFVLLVSVYAVAWQGVQYFVRARES